jgi:hypothetical protein
VTEARTRDPRYEVIGPGHTPGSITDKISEIVLTRKTPKGWWIGFGISFLLMNLLFVAVAHLLMNGIGCCCGSAGVPRLTGSLKR